MTSVLLLRNPRCQGLSYQCRRKMVNPVWIGIPVTDSCYQVVSYLCRLFSTTIKPIFVDIFWYIGSCVSWFKSVPVDFSLASVDLQRVGLAMMDSKSSNLGLGCGIPVEITIIWDFLFADHFKHYFIVVVLRITQILGSLFFFLFFERRVLCSLKALFLALFHVCRINKLFIVRILISIKPQLLFVWYY